MRTLISVSPLNSYKLECVFDDGTHKVADISDFIETLAFKPLLQPGVFFKVSNKKYFIEWSDFEIDLSADTLWHIGKLKD